MSRDQADAERTPSARQRMSAPGDSSSLMTGAIQDEIDTGNTPMLGFTLSHLRRVPELSILAQRVVQAEAKRRAREETKRAQLQMKSKPPASSSSRAPPMPSGNLKRTNEPEGRKMKRLFQFAIRQLFEEGAIVLWDGPVRKASDAISLCTLWKVGSSQDTLEEWDEDPELSDPEDGEESYVPLRPEYFLCIVENAIRAVMARATADAKSASRDLSQDEKVHMSTASRTLALHQRLLLQAQGSAPPPGPTPAEILKWLKRDERWARVGEWAVKEALEYGRKEGRVWCVGDGRWEGCW